MIAYAWRVKKYFKFCTTAIDIGCGIGYQTAKLSKLLPDTHFVMLDIDGDDPAVSFSYTGYAHNQLALTKQYAHQHVNGTVYDVADYNWNDTVQVVYSTLSWGWHYPVDVYIKQVLKLRPDYIIIDCRHTIEIIGYKIIDSFRINRKENTVVYELVK